MPTKKHNTNPLRAITGYSANSPLRMAGVAQGGASLITDVGNIASGNVQAQSAKGEGGRILGDVGKYAAMGAAAGPIGAGVGALVGLTVGLVKNKKAKEAYKEQQTEQANQRAASNAQAQLAANVNSQNQANNEIMANTKPGIKRTLSSLGYSSSIKKQSSMEYNKSEMMRTISGASSLKKVGEDPKTGVFYPGETAGVTEGGKRFLKSETSGTTGYDDGSEKFDAKYKAQIQKKNKAITVKENKVKKEQLKKDTEAANKRARANAESNK
tara:strand:- start:698 stop:1507 length:810 start_codon:yes stop_codon:yes gene_type:complete